MPEVEGELPGVIVSESRHPVHAENFVKIHHVGVERNGSVEICHAHQHGSHRPWGSALDHVITTFFAIGPGPFSQHHAGEATEAWRPQPPAADRHWPRSVSAWSGWGGVWTKAARTAAARHAPEPTKNATRGPPAEMIHPVRMLPMGVVPRYTKT